MAAAQTGGGQQWPRINQSAPPKTRQYGRVTFHSTFTDFCDNLVMLKLSLSGVA
jgi:hypothetical protein